MSTYIYNTNKFIGIIHEDNVVNILTDVSRSYNGWHGVICSNNKGLLSTTVTSKYIEHKHSISINVTQDDSGLYWYTNPKNSTDIVCFVTATQRNGFFPTNLHVKTSTPLSPQTPKCCLLKLKQVGKKISLT